MKERSILGYRTRGCACAVQVGGPVSMPPRLMHKMSRFLLATDSPGLVDFHVLGLQDFPAAIVHIGLLIPQRQCSLSKLFAVHLDHNTIVG